VLIDLVLDGKAAVVVGGGKEAEFKAVRLLDARARTIVLAEAFTPGIRRMAAKGGLVRVVKASPSPASLVEVLQEARPRVVFISTGDTKLDEELASAARSGGPGGAIVCVVDDPRLNDFNMPAIARKGDIRIGVSTGGRSPAMAAIIRGRIEGALSREDVLQVRLQGHMRRIWKKWLKDPESRKRFAYRLIGDEKIASHLGRNDYAGARRLAEKMLREESLNA
jgi:siroheme synthase-like protein